MVFLIESGPTREDSNHLRGLSRLMKNASLGYRERAGVVIEAPLDADSE